MVFPQVLAGSAGSHADLVDQVHLELRQALRIGRSGPQKAIDARIGRHAPDEFVDHGDDGFLAAQPLVQSLFLGLQRLVSRCCKE